MLRSSTDFSDMVRQPNGQTLDDISDIHCISDIICIYIYILYIYINLYVMLYILMR